MAAIELIWEAPEDRFRVASLMRYTPFRRLK